ncbi:MAG: proprotein convertase P-domain-containing protein, partial [Thermoanaerobaculia bacterium]|nr:proprotein convertase P-domain-containing protein [Thermoanaerobaculia bacterium]
MQNKRILGWAIAALMVGTLASAQDTKDGSSVVGVVETPEGCTAVTDNAYDGSIATMTCLTVAGPNQVISDVNVEVTMTHTWVGDIVLKLVSPSAQVLTLMSRPGLVEPADDGTDCCGSSADVLSSSLVTFDDEAGASAESFVGTAGSYIPAPGAGPGTNLAQYDGQNATGNWQVCMGDSAAGDPGSICSADLVFAVVGCTVDVTCPGDQVGSAPPGATSGTVTFPAPTVGGTCASVTT